MKHRRFVTAVLLASACAAVPVSAQTAAPPAKTMVDVGGHKLNVQVGGTARPGVPAVVFESGLGSTLVAWFGVPAEVTSITRTVAYERAGPATGSGAAGVYTLTSGGYNLTLSGSDLSTSSSCRMTGSGHLPFLVGQTSLIVDGAAPPYTYSWDAMTLTPPAPAGSILGRRTNCPPGSEGFEGTTFQINLFSPLHASGQVSADGVTYAGTTADTVMTIHWQFTGTG